MRKWTRLIIITGLVVILAAALPACSATLPEGKFIHQTVQLGGKQADGYVIPLGKANIVCVITGAGMAGCGAFDVAALDSFTYPAFKVKSSGGSPIATIDDLLNGTVKEANAEAGKLGIKAGMSTKEALGKM